MTWLLDPTTREPLPAFGAEDQRLHRVGGEVFWLGEHDSNEPDWELSTVSEIGMQYARKCQRPCVHLPRERHAGCVG